MERADYRRSKEADLLAGLRAHDPLALAEAYHRTSPAAHACARRLLGNAHDTEALMHAVYGELWASPPETARLEGWVRSQCFRLGVEHLRAQEQAPASPSLALLLPTLPPPTDASHDPAEEALAALPEADRRVLLLAHDQGLATAAQDSPDAAAALERALLSLAGAGEGTEDGSTEECADVNEMADWTLGLLEADQAAQVTAQVIDRPACAARSRALRRGRRRLEGLPAAPDLGQRVLASVLGFAGAPPAPAASDHDGPAAPAPSTPSTPMSSLGDAPATPMPVAPLPSALDEWPPTPSDSADDTPEHGISTSPPKDAEAAVPPPAPAEEGEAPPGATEDATAGPSDADTAEDAVGHTESLDRVADEGADELADEVADKDTGKDTDTDIGKDADKDADTRTKTAPTDGKGRKRATVAGAPRTSPKRRKLVRQLLNALAILVVLAVGAGLGLLIGFLLVGGR